MNKKRKKDIDSLVNKRLRTPPAYLFLSGAQKHTVNPKNNVWMPDDESVEEMRDYSIENKL